VQNCVQLHHHIAASLALQAALFYLSLLSTPFFIPDELQLLTSKSFGKPEFKCRRVRRLHYTQSSTALTHHTVFFAVMECDASDRSFWDTANFSNLSMVALGSILSSKTSGFSRCLAVTSGCRSSCSGFDVSVGPWLKTLLQQPSCQWLLQDVASARSLHSN
jgi:hypothetical protein